MKKTLFSNVHPASAKVAVKGRERRSGSRQQFGLNSLNRKHLPDQKPPQSRTFTKSPVFKKLKVKARSSGSHVTASVESVHSEAETTIPIPVDHTTAAHGLLFWPSVKKLLRQQKALGSFVPNEDYMMEIEERRGVLRVYGVGQARNPGGGGYDSPAHHGPRHSRSHSSSRNNEAQIF